VRYSHPFAQRQATTQWPPSCCLLKETLLTRSWYLTDGDFFADLRTRARLDRFW
jgi:hypothetical protein